MEFIQARWFTPTSGRAINLAVMHRMEAPDKPNTAEAVAHYFQNLPATRKASAHRCYDSDSVVQSVLDKDIAYGAPGVNHDGLHYELAGYSAQDDWRSPTIESMLRLAANDVASDAARYKFPVLWRSAADLKAGYLDGITSHWEVTKAGIGGNDHTDPGPFFPIGRFMELVQSAPMAPQAAPAAMGHFLQTEDFLSTLDRHTVMDSVKARDCGIDADGLYELHADGGVFTQPVAGSNPPPFHGSYGSLDPGYRNADRLFVGITPRRDAPGYIIWANDAAFYTFGPGLNPTGLP